MGWFPCGWCQGAIHIPTTHGTDDAAGMTLLVLAKQTTRHNAQSEKTSRVRAGRAEQQGARRTTGLPVEGGGALFPSEEAAHFPRENAMASMQKGVARRVLLCWAVHIKKEQSHAALELFAISWESWSALRLTPEGGLAAVSMCERRTPSY